MRGGWVLAGGALAACGFDAVGTLPTDDVALDASTPAGDAEAESHEITLDASPALRDEVIALYTFMDAPGLVVRDLSGTAPASDLVIESGSETRWDPTGLTTLGAGAHVSTTDAKKVSTACKARNELSIEAWVQPAVAAQGGPARIVTMSNGTSARNFTLGMGEQGGNVKAMYILRLGTKNDPSWNVATPTGSALASMQHVVATAKFPGVVRIYVDGMKLVDTPLPSDFSPWTEGFPLVLGGEVGVNDRRFLGTYAFVAIYCRELSQAEVDKYRAAGPPRR